MIVDKKSFANNLQQFTSEDLAALVFTSGLRVDLVELRQKRTAIHWLLNSQNSVEDLAELAARASRLRPDLDWPEVTGEPGERPLSFQELMPGNHCWGCGPTNGLGLGIKSYWQGDEGVCTFIPEAQHTAGPDHILNGGIMATVIDCHTVCTAVADAYRRQDRPIGSEPLLWYATGGMNIQYLRPTPIDEPLRLRATVVSYNEKKSVAICEVFSLGKVRAKAEVTAVLVPPTWLVRQSN